ncbi:MAG: SRPBCC family protein [Bdellovibrionales bacterium]|nr:SRPBCC family protein [Bdellovibrionales bacterium]
MAQSFKVDPKRDLVLERIVDIPPELIFKAWTTPDILMKWFCPRPWKTIDCVMDLRPGGRFSTTMQSPEGQNFPNEGCLLEIVPNRKLVWTSALTEGYRPIGAAISGADLLFTGMIILEPHGAHGTKYTAIGIHKDEADCRRHAEMGFQEGWGIVLDQLVAEMKGK